MGIEQSGGGLAAMKVLIAEDELVSQRLLESTLRRWGYEVTTASDGLEALRLLQQPDAPQLAILDWLMPGLDGTQLCREVRRLRTEPYTYIVLLTGKTSKGDMVEGLDAGADDYIIKPYDAQELQVRLRTGKRILHLQEQLIAARESLRHQATRDGLTGIWNRHAIAEILTNELERAKRHGGTIGVAMIDLDHFKQINDVHGHLVGDSVLKACAQTVQNVIRSYDSVGRLGGEEFLLVLPGCSLANTTSHAERVRAAISRVALPTNAGAVHVSASLGVAVYQGDRSYDAESIMHAADQALYRAKRNGRDRVEFAEEMSQAVCSASN
jgi:diguanylate cyclase (GGDEF)-like protein